MAEITKDMLGAIVNGSDFLSFCELLLILGAIIAIIP